MTVSKNPVIAYNQGKKLDRMQVLSRDSMLE